MIPPRMAGDALHGAIGHGFNLLPDRVNLFARYATRYGDRNLKLDPSTLSDLRNAVSEQNRPFLSSGPMLEEEGFDPQGKPIKFKMQDFKGAQGPFQPRSGPVYPYDKPDKSVSNTLGRFMADVNLKDNQMRIIDKYDMENEAEDPDLVTGKFQPRKALNQLEAIYNPAAAQRNFKKDAAMRMPDKGYDADTVKAGAYSSTHSPMSQVGRALLYLSPVKPKPFRIDVTIPVSGRIRD